MLPRENRMTQARDFRVTLSRGQRQRSGPVVVHRSAVDSDDRRLVGLVVSKAVGNAVVRNRVKRRLREVMRAELVDLPTGTRVVCRALPQSAEASQAVLARHVEQALKGGAQQ